MKMKKRKLLDLNETLNQLLDLGKTRFKLGVLENLEVLKSIVVPIRKIEEDNKSILDNFEKDRVNLVVKFGIKNPDGSVTVDQSDEKSYTEFAEEFKKILSIHEQSLQLHKLKTDELDEILDEEYTEELKFKQFTEEQLPEEGISGKQLMLLMECGIIK